MMAFIAGMTPMIKNGVQLMPAMLSHLTTVGSNRGFNARRRVERGNLMTKTRAERAAQRAADRTGKPVYIWNGRFPRDLDTAVNTGDESFFLDFASPHNRDVYTVVPR